MHMCLLLPHAVVMHSTCCHQCGSCFRPPRTCAALIASAPAAPVQGFKCCGTTLWPRSRAQPAASSSSVSIARHRKYVLAQAQRMGSPAALVDKQAPLAETYSLWGHSLHSMLAVCAFCVSPSLAWHRAQQWSTRNVHLCKLLCCSTPVVVELCSQCCRAAVVHVGTGHLAEGFVKVADQACWQQAGAATGLC